jgi:hypothetical protein
MTVVSASTKTRLTSSPLRMGGGTEHSGEKRRGPMARTDGDSRVGVGRWTSGRAGSGVGAT